MRVHCLRFSSLKAVLPVAAALLVACEGSSHAAVPGEMLPAAAELVVRTLDVGQGDATYITNGGSRVMIDGGPDEARYGKLLDSLGVHDDTIDVVILTHAHLDHYSGLRELFRTRRHITVRYFFENQDPSPNVSLRQLRDSIASRVRAGSLVYRDANDPCGDGTPICTIELRGGARLHVMRPSPIHASANDRSVPVKLVGPDSASFTMWLAGDAERDAIAWFLGEAGYARAPGMHVNLLKADHHGSCNGVTAAYLSAISPDTVVVSAGAVNDYGHMHEQAKATYRDARVAWYRTDQNGTITIRSPGTPHSGYHIAVGARGVDRDGPSDRRSSARVCRTD
jgi:competence protein ComEC